MVPKPNQLQQARKNEEALGTPPYRIVILGDFDADYVRTPPEVLFAVADVLQQLQTSAQLGLCNGTPALKPLTGRLTGWWRIAVAVTDRPEYGEQYRLLLKPEPKPKRGKQVLKLAALLPRSVAYDTFLARVRRAT